MLRFYSDLARLWPVVSPPSHYAGEARHWRDAIRSHLGPGRHHLLELGVGGGNNLSHLTSEFDATALDLSDAMMANSRRLNPAVAHHVGDMRSARLSRTFDAVIAHDAISYLTSEDDLRRTFATAAAHLRPGGLFVCAPDWYRETFAPTASAHGPRGEDPEVTMFEHAFDPDPADTTIQVPLATWLHLLDGAGFEPGRRPYPVHPDGREAWLLTGVLREPGARRA
jgi:SAM-dependent methyltransferase